MAAQPVALLEHAPGSTKSPSWAMLKAESKKLTHRKGVMAFTIIGTIGVIVITFAILEIYHLSNPVKYTYPGGTSGFNTIVVILSRITIIPASILGTTAGSQDMESGVIRDMIVTGRSRTSIYLLRLKGTALVWLPAVIVAYLLGLVAVFAFAGTHPNPSLHLIIDGGLYCVGVSLVYALTAAGLASLFGNRGPAIAVMIGWTFIIESLLVNVAAIGVVRQAFLTTAITALAPVASGKRRLEAAGVNPSTVVSYITIIGWPVVLNILGWFRSERLEA